MAVVDISVLFKATNSVYETGKSQLDRELLEVQQYFTSVVHSLTKQLDFSFSYNASKIESST